MQRLRIAGLAVTLGGAAVHVAGVTVASPGRVFSVTAVVLGIVILALGPGGRDRAATGCRDSASVERGGPAATRVGSPAGCRAGVSGSEEASR